MSHPPSFRLATDAIAGLGVTQGELAERLGVSRSFIGRARLDPRHPRYLAPPLGWQRAVVEIARARAAGALELVAALEGRPQDVAAIRQRILGEPGERPRGFQRISRTPGRRARDARRLRELRGFVRELVEV